MAGRLGRPMTRKTNKRTANCYENGHTDMHKRVKAIFVNRTSLPVKLFARAIPDHEALRFLSAAVSVRVGSVF